jgi:hypothetical protein
MDYIEDDPEGSRRIYLSGKHSDKYTLVDESDYQELSRYRWHLHNKGYITRYNRISKNKYNHVYIHRQILNLLDKPELEGDHENNDRMDNRRSNLRVATRKQNCQNISKTKRITSSKYKGVRSRDKNWIAIIKTNRKTQHIGTFRTEYAAAKAYDQRAKEIFGDFAKLNIPTDIDYSDLEKYRVTQIYGVPNLKRTQPGNVL